MDNVFDWTVLYWIQNNIRNDGLDRFFLGFTRLGNIGTIWLLFCSQMFFFTKKYRKAAICVLIGLALGIVIGNMLVKNLVLRPRPCWLETGVEYLLIPTDYSFPSGHALSCTIAATIMTFADRRLGFIAIPVAALIIFSRLYLFVHFPTDVVGGMVLGFLIAAIVVWYSDLTNKGLCTRYPCRP